MDRDDKLRRYLEVSPFNPVVYESESSGKILMIIQKLSRIMKKLIWSKVKDMGLTATQGEILVHILFNPQERRKVSVISDEFGISKPTVSRAVNIITDKGFVEKKVDEDEKRSHILSLTQKGLEAAIEISSYGNVIADIIRLNFGEDDRRNILMSLLSIVEKLVENNVAREFPSCIFCKHFQRNEKSFWCDKLQMVIMPETIRLNCDIFEISAREKKEKRKKRAKKEVSVRKS